LADARARRDTGAVSEEREEGGAKPAVDDDEPPDAVLEALWKRVLEAWDDDKTHAAVIEHAVREQRLPDVAGRYRALKDDPEKGVRAQKKLDAIVIAATQMLYTMKTPPRQKVPLPITLTALAVSLLLLGWVAYALWHH
jgi:hypothetical protein